MKVFNFINFWKAGIPIIISMVLQALYNIIDTAFVINMGPILGEKANLALTYAFPIQIFMIALGVGTGIGINALLSRYLGENNEKEIKKSSKFFIHNDFNLCFICHYWCISFRTIY